MDNLQCLNNIAGFKMGTNLDVHSDGIARVYGMSNVQAEELVE